MRFYESWSIIKRLLFCLGIFMALCLLLFLDGLVRTRLTGLFVFVFLANCLFLYRAVLLPLKERNRQFLRFYQGYDSRSIFIKDIHYSQAEKLALKKLGQLLDNKEANQLSNRQAQYLALQNQINPHFLYNTLEAIRGEALSEGMENIANITEAMATFFRYTISNMDNLVSLEEELSNAENYFAIQNYRFGERISMQVDIEPGSEAARDVQVPKLTLQPIIENAIIHGLEHQVRPGAVSVHIGIVEQRLLIEITDDGVGMSESTLDELNRRLLHPETVRAGDEKPRIGGIALLNVDNRIKLIFGEQYGLKVSSIKGYGTRVEVSLPVKLPSIR